MTARADLRGLDLLDAAIRRMEAEPPCPAGRTRCEDGMGLAAWVAELAGGRWETAPDASHGSALLMNEPGDPAGLIHFGTIAAHWRAQRLLGIAGKRESDALLDPRASLADIKAIRDGLRAAATGSAA